LLFIKVLQCGQFLYTVFILPGLILCIHNLHTNILFSNRIPKSKQYGISILAILLVSGLSFYLSSFIGYKVVAYLLLVTLSLLAIFFDISVIIFTAALSALIWDFFFIPPRFTIQVNTTEDLFLLIMYFVIALVHTALLYKIRQVQKIAREKEEKANTFKLYNTLLNSLSHELRTPIATIVGATDNLLSSNGKLSDQNKHSLLTEISVASLRLNHQVKNLLDMSRLESGTIQLKKDWCNLNELVYTAINRMGDILNHHVLDVNVPESLPLFKLDEGLMEQVLRNILNNAAIYTPVASSIIIKGKYQEPYCLVTIEDNGHGFPEEEISYVFEKFYRLKSSKPGGTGLGLSIAKGFVEAHGGTIQLENAPLGGALFTIRIPTEIAHINNLQNE
jgi:two-component system sensor histidine kinase KdpD